MTTEVTYCPHLVCAELMPCLIHFHREQATKPVNYHEWLQQYGDELKPPVCNKLMYSDQLKVMFVGGKNRNERLDYHMEEGEELFLQIKGGMVLKVMEESQRKDVVIKEGEIFLLPPRIPHSPQRVPDTIGLVIERVRRSTETDGLRWYVPNTTDPLYEKFFYCEDLGVQLGPAIKEFNESKACQTQTPDLEDGTVLPQIPITLDVKTKLPDPFNLQQWLQEDEVSPQRDLFMGKDFRVIVFRGPASHTFKHERSEVFIFQMHGTSTLTLLNGSPVAVPLKEGDMIIVNPNQAHSVSHDPNSLQMQVVWHSS